MLLGGGGGCPGTFRRRDLEFEGPQRVWAVPLQDGSQITEVQAAPFAARDTHDAEFSQAAQRGGER
jgi:hypothetical protein